MADKKGKKGVSRRDGPYRGEAEGTPEAAPADGLVGDLVRQFADPYALFRELAQNAIDAGTTEIHVRIVIVREGDAHEARISVSDDGCGMSQEVLEEDLVVLFRSTKEDRGDTIGKFGVGFVSVLAIEPSLVTVSTCTGDAMRHVLHLHPDRSYDLYREPGGTRGTTVTLHVPLKDAGEELAQRSEAALVRWCGHASVPIHLTVIRPNELEPTVQRRIDAPMEIEGALVSVRIVSHDGEAEAVVGLVPEGAQLAAYYNRGLLLHASKERGTRASVAFKVSDRRLSHTLSREDVRLDEAHARAVRLVEHGIAQPLTQEVAKEIADTARAHVAGDGAAGARWLALVGATRVAELAIEPRAIDVPLVAPVAGTRVARCLGIEGSLLVARERDALVDLLAARGVAVVDAAVVGDDARKEVLDALLAAYTGGRPSHPRARHTAIVPLGEQALTDADRGLLARTTELLALVVRRPSGLHLVDVIGHDLRLTYVLDGKGGAQLTTDPRDEADPFRLALRPPLGLSTRHPIVEAARAHRDPVVAADVLTRAVLLDRGLATEARSLALTDASLRGLFASGATR